MRRRCTLGILPFNSLLRCVSFSPSYLISTIGKSCTQHFIYTFALYLYFLSQRLLLLYMLLISDTIAPGMISLPSGDLCSNLVLSWMCFLVVACSLPRFFLFTRQLVTFHSMFPHAWSKVMEIRGRICGIWQWLGGGIFKNRWRSFALRRDIEGLQDLKHSYWLQAIEITNQTAVAGGGEDRAPVLLPVAVCLVADN